MLMEAWKIRKNQVIWLFASINCLGRANRVVTTALRSLTPAQSAIHLKDIQVP